MNLLLVTCYAFMTGLIACSLKRNLVISLVRGRMRFRCRRCADCCRLIVRLTERDIEDIEALGYKRADFAEEIPDLAKYMPSKVFTNNVLKRKDGSCVFFKIYGGKGCCTIHASKPGECSKFPEKSFCGIKIHDYRCKGFDDPLILRML